MQSKAKEVKYIHKQGDDLMKKLLILIVATMLLLAGCGAATEQTDWGETNLKDVYGSEVKISDFEGEPTVIKVWSSWCSICLSGLKHYDELSAMDLDANILSMVEPGRNSEMDEEKFAEWFLSLDDYENITVLLDTEGIAKNEFGVRGYPTIVYLDENGDVFKVQPGHQTNEQIIETLGEIKKE